MRFRTNRRPKQVDILAPENRLRLLDALVPLASAGVLPDPSDVQWEDSPASAAEDHAIGARWTPVYVALGRVFGSIDCLRGTHPALLAAAVAYAHAYHALAEQLARREREAAASV